MIHPLQIQDLRDSSKRNSLLGQVVSLQGWAWRVRGSGQIRFIQVRDGSGFMQVVAEASALSEELFEQTKRLSQETSIKVSGILVENTREALGVEIQLQTLEVLGTSTDYPITPKEHGTDFLMDLRHLWLRSPRQQAILRVRHVISQSIRSYFDDLGFTLVDAPIFTAYHCEGTSTLFGTEYFDKQAFLSQSGQLYMEAAAMAVGKAYCFGPTFRAENSNTRRHLTEFWMVEPEVAFMELDEDMLLAQGLIHLIIQNVLDKCAPELKILERDTEKLKKSLAPFVQISYDEAVEILHKAGEEFVWGDDFGGGHETIIAQSYETPVIVHRYPASLKPYYMRKDPNKPQVALNMDVLAPEGYGEIVGGGEREFNFDILKQALNDHQISEEDFKWYLDLRQYGSVPHAGFGLGLERTVAWICGLPHVRETIPFPRLPNRLTP